MPTRCSTTLRVLTLAALAVPVGACRDTPTRPPAERSAAPTRAGRPHFAVAVDLTADAVSSTGVPLMQIPVAITPAAMNDGHWVAGRDNQVGSATIAQAALWEGGTGLTILSYSGVFSSRALDINNAGTVVGELVTLNAPFLWTIGGGTVLLPTPPLSDGTGSYAKAIDQDGNIVVFYSRTSPSGNATAVLAPPYAYADYAPVPYDPSAGSIFHVNGVDIDGGLVVGSGSWNEGWSWQPGDAAVTLLGGTNADAVRGAYIAGRDQFGGEYHATFLPGPSDLGTLGGTFSAPHDVNASGWVVGSSTTAGGETHAFLWRSAAEGMVDLGTLGGNASNALSIDAHGHILGTAKNASGTLVPVIWMVDAGNEPPAVDAIADQTVTVGQTLVVTPTVIDPEGDPYTLSWDGVPSGATAGSDFSWTPVTGDEGTYTVTVTATQDNDASLSDSKSFGITVEPAATPTADVSVTVAPTAPQQQLIGDHVAYTAHVHNAGPDPAPVGLTVELQFRDQAEWGTVPPEAVTDGALFIDLGTVAADATVDVPFEVVYHAFGTQLVTATAAADATDPDASNDAGTYSQAIDLDLSAPGVQVGGLDIPGGDVSDGLGLAVVGVRVPGELVAGRSAGEFLFVPSDLTPAGPAASLQGVWLTDATFTPGALFVPGSATLPADLPVTGVPALQPAEFIPVASAWLPGRVVIPALADWAPAGRLLFARGGTNVLVTDHASTTLSFENGTGPGLRVGGAGGAADGALGLCGQAFSVLVGNGDAAELLCGSLTTTVLTGEIGIVLADGTRLDVPAGATSYIQQTADGYEVTATGGPVTITRPDGTRETVAAGQTVVLAPLGVALEGCSAGFWSKRADTSRYPTGWPPTGYSPDDDLGAVFGVSLDDPVTLGDALAAHGGGLNALLRQAVSALLNAVHPDVHYGLTHEAVVSTLADALSRGEYDAAAQSFDELNKTTCPIDGK